MKICPLPLVIAPLAAAMLLTGCSSMPSIGRSATGGESREQNAFGTYLSARFAAGQHAMPEAARYYSRSLKNDPDNPDILPLTFFYTAASGDLEGAGKYATAIVAKSPDDRSARLALAVIAFKHKNYADARKHLSLSAKGPFQTLVVSLFDGWAAAASGDAAGAAADMKALAAQSGAESLAAFHSALIADYLGQAQADADYQKALAANRTSPRVVQAYGNYLERAGRREDARALYEKHQAESALTPVVQQGLARIAANRKPDPFLRGPEDGVAESLFGMAASLNDRQGADVSILYLRMALYLRPDLALADLLLASRFENLGRYEDAVAVYRKIDKSSPYYRMAATQAAVDESRLDRKSAATEQLRTLAADFPGEAENWIALGDAYRGEEKYAAAIDAYDRAEKALGAPEKRDWPLFYARAMAESAVKNWEKAEADIKLALKLSPEQPELLNFLGYSWVDRNENIPEALTMLEKARQLRPYDGYIVDSVGWAYYRLGRYDDATRTLEAAVLLVPGDPTVNNHLGDALWKAGRRLEARYQWNHALTFNAEGSEKAEIEQKLKTGLAG
ncbi:MAG: tetratricopeptide repeat protein [Alphaproteobacteria bacterium]|nr:tetratricopeptide repeat protein [Alphaproteobacteria bacterium]